MVVVVPGDPVPLVWLDHDGRHDIRSGVDIVTPLRADESTQLIRADIAAGIADLQAALTVASADIAAATTRQGQAVAFAAAARTQRDTVTAWSPTTSGATDLATLKARTVADLTTVRGAVADVLDRVATAGDAVGELYAARALLATGLSQAYRDLIYLSRLASDLLD